MPGVQSAAFTLLLPAGAAYEGAAGLNLGGGAATMAAEWITRGAGQRDSRELLTALDNLGVSHAESAQTLHTSLAAATLGRNLEPGPGDLRRHGAPPPPRRRRGRADPGPLPAEPAEPGGRPRHEGHLRAAPAALPRPVGPPLAGDRRGGRRADARGASAVPSRRPTGPTARSWASPERSTGRGCATRSAGCSATGSRGPSRRSRNAPAGRAATTSSARPSRSRSRWPIPRRPSPAPTITAPAPPPRSWAAIRRPGSSPRSARNAGCATRSTPATKASATAPPCSATPAPRPTGRSRPST